MTTHKLNKKAIAVTGLPDDATDVKIVDGTDLFYYSDMGGSFSKPHGFHHSMEVCGFPAGNWKLLGFAQDLREEDWKMVVPMQDEHPDFDYWFDYTEIEPRGLMLLSALQSGHSLLKSEGLYVSNPFTKPVEDEYMPSENFTKKQQDEYWQAHRKWQEAQLLTNPLILIIE